MSRVSVIIVNYNGQGLIKDCLKAAERQSFKDFKVVVVDNGSSDGSLLDIRRFLEESPIGSSVKLVPLEQNLGFAGGNGEGLKHADGEYIALLNNDAAPDKNWLGELVMAMDSNPEVGICASKLIIYGSDTIDSAGDGFSTSLKGFKRGTDEKAFLYNKREFVFGACAGAALYRRKMIEEIGFLDEDFFLIHEDTDLNFRAQLSGWKVMYVPTAIVDHKVSSTIGKMSPMAVYYSVRNSEFVKIKNIPLSLFLRCLPVVILGMVSEFIYFAARHRHPILYFKAKIDVIRMLYVMLKKRRVNLTGAKVDSKGLREIVTPVFDGFSLRKRLKKLFFG